jgi:hypothetical protein
MTEQIIFQHEGVQITKSRFVNGNQTYAMSNITSVKSFENKPSYASNIFVFLVGLATLTSYPVVSLICFAAAAVTINKKSTFHIMLTTSGGEVSALETHEKDYIEKVVAALNQAIIARG